MSNNGEHICLELFEKGDWIYNAACTAFKILPKEPIYDFLEVNILVWPHSQRELEQTNSAYLNSK